MIKLYNFIYEGILIEVYGKSFEDAEKVAQEIFADLKKLKVQNKEGNLGP
ncbi:hypothetical protein UACE39S_01730 [Ureibacillus acetophenoni]